VQQFQKTLLRERLISCVLLCFLLVGCQGVSPDGAFSKSLGPPGAALDLLLRKSAEPVPQSNQFEYLQAELNSVKILLALGKRTIDANNVVVEHWYSAQSELLEIRNGRIWRLSGATTEWRGQVAAPPSWSALANAGHVKWQRQLDIMPGYRYGQTDHIVSHRLSIPPATAPKTLSTQPQQLSWFSDTITSRDEAGQPWTFEQVFAIDSGSGHPNGRWIYSEQCVSPVMCVKLRYLGFVK
jgi:hypothetical protein